MAKKNKDMGDLTGQVVLLSSKYYKGREEERKFLCEGGFGCSPFTMGTAVFGKFLSDGESARVERYEVECVLYPYNQDIKEQNATQIPPG